MTAPMNRASRAVRILWNASRPLTAVGLLMSAVLVVTVVGLAVDDRIITGVPAWLKPAKFALSTAVYSLTLAWLFSLLPEWRRVRTVVGWTTALVFVLEVGIIDLQAWRGTTSHFNVSTPLDATLFGIMGSAILIQTAASIAVAFALWRQPFANRALAGALRAGMVITILGAASGSLMTRPTAAQLEAARAGEPMTLSGAHTVGTADGGPGLPGIGWSREHGDLRIGHFVGLHAIQILPLLAVMISRRRSPIAAAALLRVAAASYAALVALLLFQALRGESIAAPGFVSGLLFTLWAASTAIGAWRAGRHQIASHQTVTAGA